MTTKKTQKVSLPPNIFAQFETDKSTELNGQWVRGIREGMNVLVARWGNDNYKKMFQRLIKPVRQQFDRGTLSDEQLTDITTQCMASTILLDWDGPGFRNRDGTELKYTTAVCLDLLSSLPDFRDEVVTLSRESETYRLEQREGSAGN